MAEVTTFVPHSLTRSCAFWDVEDFPVPVGGDLSSFSCNLRKAMYDGVFRRAPFIKAYSAVQTQEVNDRYDQSISRSSIKRMINVRDFVRCCWTLMTGHEANLRPKMRWVYTRRC